MIINIKDFVGIRDFLGDDFDRVMDFILESRHYVYSFFENKELDIEISYDPEGGTPSIFACIPYKFMDGEELMEKFEDTWLLDNMQRIDCKVVYCVVREEKYEA